MTLIFTKGEIRHRLICRRPDGSCEHADLGPELPGHDLAHYVVETELGLPRGFYGNLAAGYSLEQLNDKAVIQSLPPESMVAEVLTRNLQAMARPGAKAEAYLELVRWELEVLQWPMPEISPEQVTSMYRTLRGLLDRWEHLIPGESLELEFSVSEPE